MKQSKSKVFKCSLLSIFVFMLSAVPFLFGVKTPKLFGAYPSKVVADISTSEKASKITNTAIDLTPKQTTPTSTVLESGDYRIQSEYLNFYSVPTSMFSYSNNGGAVAGNELSKAFDRNFNTCFKSAQDNNVNVVDKTTNEVLVTNFLNHIDVTFNQTVNINRLIYGTENGTTRGYPTELNLYFNNGNGWQQICNIKSTETSNLVVFDFGTTFAIKQFRFEYVKVPTYHKYQPTAREIIFLQPENELFEDYSNLFTDYTQTKLNSKYSTFEKVKELENKLKQNVNYSLTQTKLDRAKQVALNKVVYAPQREFSTNQNAQNVIKQYGNIEAYCRNNLQLNAFGTNRQTTGVLAYAGQQITIYVEAEANDPLPKIRFSQHVGYWSKWLSGELQLSVGKNTFTVPNFKTDDYSIDVPLGGPIYICNPYSSTEQSSDVKVYIEGGALFPVLTATTDTKAYKLQLNEYAKQVQANPSEVVDLTEIVTDHAILTVTATKANEIYANFNPSQAITNWNNFMDQLLEFDGITQNKSNPLFDERNLHASVNIRVVQPWAGAAAYAYSEHIGVYYSWQSSLITGSGFGWGIPHEIGHMMDNPNRTIGETTNNMFAKYNETVIEKLNARGEFAKTTTTLSNDLIYDATPYFNSNRYNFLIWWYIECWQKGYWANLENCYRGTNTTLKLFLALDSTIQTQINNLKPTEKQVLFSSLVTGIDMSYYFDRWGYSLTNKLENDPVFKIANASKTFKELMSLATTNGIIDNTKQPKLWYQTATAYHNTNTTPIYSSSTVASIQSITKTATGYNIFINHTNNENHLGYEIWQGDETNGYKQIGFSYTNAFTDLTTYPEGYTPNYKVVAVDNTFSSSCLSVAMQPQTNSQAVCKIGETEYNSLLEAVRFAQSDDTILLLKSCSSVNLTIDKNLTFAIAEGVEGDITISKIEAGNLISVAPGATFNLVGKSTNWLILDGNGFTQNGALISTAGTVKVQYIVLTNNVSSGNGGAIILLNNSKNSTFENCKITNNKAQNGSALFGDYASASATFLTTIISDNVSTKDGILAFKCNISLNRCEIKNNKSQTGTIKNYAGGILNTNNCIITQNTAEIGAGLHIDGYTNIKYSQISNNTATKQAGGIYFSTTVAVRQLIIDNSVVQNNTAVSGNDIVIVSGNLTLKNTIVGDDEQSGEIGLLGGKTTINAGANIQAQINIKFGSELILDGGVFTNLTNCTFNLLDFVDDMCILKANNFALTDAYCEQVNLSTSNISAKLKDNTIIGKASPVGLTLNFGSLQQTKTYKYGEIVTLDFDLLPTQYAVSFSDQLGNEYSFNSKITMQVNITLTANLGNKVKINFDYGAKTETAYYTPYTMFSLPNFDGTELEADKKLIAWGNSSAIYSIQEPVVAISNTTYTAVYEQLFLLTLKNKGKVVYTGYYEYGTEIDLSTLYQKTVSYWLNNGTKIDGSKVIINGDTTLEVAHTAKWHIVPILTTTFVLGFTIAITIMVLIKKHKQKAEK